MANFPTIQLPSSRKRVISKPQVKSDFESGYAQIRSRGTRAKRKWTLKWDHLNISDWKILEQHFIDNSGDLFLISKEMLFEQSDFTVMYSIDEITAESSNIIGHYSVEIQVEEQ